MSDSASFDWRKVEAVYGIPYRCHITGDHRGIELHHVLGRGHKRYRKIMSSLLNCIPLRDDVHDGWQKARPSLVRVYLEIAFEKFSQALGQGKIEIQEKDKEFMEYADSYLALHNLPPLYT